MFKGQMYKLLEQVKSYFPTEPTLMQGDGKYCMQNDNPTLASERVLLLLLYFRPGIFQRDDPVEYQISLRGVRIQTKIAFAHELEAVAQLS